MLRSQSGRMDSGVHISFNAEDRSYLAILKKEIHSLVAAAGFNESKTGEIDIVVAEMASNLIKHAGGGEILVHVSVEKGKEMVELISVDNGPGIPEPHKMLEDGMSTSNTLGHGLGSIKRLSDTFELFTLMDWGTIILSRIYKTKPAQPVKQPMFDVRSLVVAKPGEQVSGDGAAYVAKPNCLKIFLGDGLGHGVDAHAAVQQAIVSFTQSKDDNPIEQLRAMHTEVKKTRGLVGAIATYFFRDRKWHICGVGNIATRMQGNLLFKNCMSYNGIIGMNVPNSMKELMVDHVRGQLLIMCSDGIKTRWDLQKYTGITRFDLSVIATAIYKDFGRKTDDMSVIVARINSTS